MRKSIGDMRHTLPAGVIGPGFNDEFGDTFGIIYGFTSDGFTQRELRDRVEEVRSKLLLVPDVSKIELLGEQDEVIFVEFSTKELAALGVDRSALIAALQSQNIVRPAGTIQTSADSISIRVSGGFQSEQDIADINFSAGGRMLRLSDIARVRRGYTDPPHPMFRVNGKPAIGLAIAMRDGGDILALGANITKAMAQITAELPIGIEPSLVADQPVVGQSRHPGVHGLAASGDRHHHGGEFHQPRRATRPDHRARHTVHAGDRLADHGTAQHRHAAHIAWRADHRARVAGRRCDDDDRRDAHQTGGRGQQGRGRNFRLPDPRDGDARRHAGDDRGLHSGRICGELGRRIHFFAVCRGYDSAAGIVVRRGHFHAAAWRCYPRSAQARQLGGSGQDFPDVPAGS